MDTRWLKSTPGALFYAALAGRFNGRHARLHHQFHQRHPA
jgi:hypothetical protein